MTLALGLLGAGLVGGVSGQALAGAAAGPAFGCNGTLFQVVANQLQSVNVSSNPLTTTTIGAPYLENYNAMGFDTQNDYLYAIGVDGHLLQIASDGSVTDLGAVSGLSSHTFWDTGDFDGQGDLWVGTNGGQTLYEIDVSQSPPTANPVPISGSAPLGSDIVWVPSQGAFFSLALADGQEVLSKFVPDGATVSGSETVVSGATSTDTAFGSGWYSGGQLYFAATASLNVYDISGFSGASPASTLVATGPGPNAQNDGASCPNSQPATGYWLVGKDGGVFAFGGAQFYGSLPHAHITPVAPISGIARTSDHAGYWLVGQDGGVFAFGDAPFEGSLPGDRVSPGAAIVGIASPDNGGYWEVGADGGVFTFGDARFYGSLPASHVVPTAPVVGIVATPSGNGYWLIGKDGGVYCFGDARFYGSVPGLNVTPVPTNIVGMAATPDGTGYWVTGGGFGNFGSAKSYGNPSGPLASPEVGIASPDAGGYWVAAGDGGVFAFGDGAFYGSLPTISLTPVAPIDGIAGF